MAYKKGDKNFDYKKLEVLEMMDYIDVEHSDRAEEFLKVAVKEDGKVNLRSAKVLFWRITENDFEWNVDTYNKDIKDILTARADENSKEAKNVKMNALIERRKALATKEKK